MGQTRCDPSTQCCAPQQDADTLQAGQMCVAPANQVANSDQQGRLGGKAPPLPTAQVDFTALPEVPVGPIITPGATVTGSLKLGGQLTARPAGQDNPVTLSKGELNVGGTSGSSGGSVGVTPEGGINSKLTSTLNGITHSVQLSLNGGSPTVTFGAAGSFGAVQTGVEPGPPPTLIYTCSPTPVKKVIDGVEVVGQISYTLKLTVAPNSTLQPVRVPVEEPQHWWEKAGRWIGEKASAAWEWMKDTASDAWDWLRDHKKEVLIGTAVVAIGAAVVLSGGAAALAPALAL